MKFVMKNTDFRNWVTLFFLSLLCAGIQMWLTGYEFGASSHAHHIPYLNAMLNPELFVNDPFIQAMKTTHSSIYYPILAQILRFIPMDLFALFFFLQLLSFAFAFLAVAKLALVLTKDLGLSAFVMCAFLLPKPVLADGILFNTVHTHDSTSLPIFIFALAYALENKFRWSVCLLGIGFDIHVVSAIPIFMAIGLIFITSQKIEIKRITELLLLFLVAASPFLFYAFSMHQGPIDDFWLKVMRFRSAHHLFPFSWSYKLYISFFSLLAAALVLYFALPRRVNWVSRGLLLWMVCLICYCLAGILFAEIVPVKSIMILQPLRASRYLTLLSCISIGISVGGILLPYVSVDRIWKKIPLLGGALSLAVIIYLYQATRQEVLTDPWNELQRWAKMNIDNREIVITPPNKNGFRVFSNLSALTEWKDGTLLFHAPDTGLIWWNRMTDLGFFNRNYAKLKEADFLNLAAKYHCKFVVRFARDKLSFPLVYENKEYAMYRIRD